MGSKRNSVIHLICFLVFISVFTSCLEKQECEAPATYTIEGHLYKSCDKIPVTNFPLELLRVDNNGFGNKSGVVQSITTDQDGYFKFTYKGNEGKYMNIQYKVGWGFESVISNIPLNQSFLDLDVYFNPLINLEYYLDVKNPYSEFDTLSIGDLAIGNYKITGPFKSGFLMRIDSMYVPKMTFKNNYFSIGYVLLPWKGVSHASYFSIENYCDNVIPVTLTIE